MNIDSILGHKIDLYKLKIIEVTQNMFSVHKLKLRRTSGKSPHICKLNSTVLNNPPVKEEITRYITK